MDTVFAMWILIPGLIAAAAIVAARTFSVDPHAHMVQRDRDAAYLAVITARALLLQAEREDAMHRAMVSYLSRYSVSPESVEPSVRAVELRRQAVILLARASGVNVPQA
jgi:hypothetical protein